MFVNRFTHIPMPNWARSATSRPKAQRRMVRSLTPPVVRTALATWFIAPPTGRAPSFAFHYAKPALRRPRLDDQQGRLRVQMGDDDLGDVGKKQASGRLLVGRSGGNRPSGDLRLARPLGLLALLRVKRRTMQGEPRIPLQIRTLARPRHRPEPELTVSELALDARDPRRAVGPQRRDRLMPARVEQAPHPRRELGLRLLHVLPRRHGHSMRPVPSRGQATCP